MRRTAVIVAVPQAGPVVDPWRERTCVDKPSLGIPAHITLLFPFVPAELVDDRVLADLRSLFAATPAFEFAMRRTARFPDTLYLAPEPAEPFVRLTEEIVRRFPDYPPYEGAFDTVVPHVTVAHGEPELLDEAHADVRRALPLRSVASEAILLEELEPDWGPWGPRERFPLELM